MNKRILIALFFTVFCVVLFAQNSSVLAQASWYKISTTKNGIYKISYSSFIDLGIKMDNLQISAIKLYGNGGGMLPHLNSDSRHNDLSEIAIKIYDSNNNGVFESSDYVLFYGMSADIWKHNTYSNIFEHTTHLYSDKVYYFLTVDFEGEQKRVELKNTLLNPTKTITDYNAFSYHEQELENLIHSGKKWFGERFSNNNSQNFSFSFPNLILSEPVNIKTAVVGRSLQSSNFKINVNSTFLSTLIVPNIVTNYATEYAKEASNISLFNSNSSNIVVNLEYSSIDSGAEAWLNYIEINARRELKISGNYLTFRDVESLSNEIGKFEIQNANDVNVWDVSDPTNVMELPINLVGNVLSFNDSLNSLKEYIAFNSLAYLTPNLHSSVANQDLHGISNNIEFIIVVHPDFISAANRLADFHLEKDNMHSIVVTPQQIYNEFSSGMQDVSAIRDFVKHQYDKDNSALKYLLLIGDGSYDPKNRVQNNTNFIPTYQSENSTHPTQSYVTDDYFGLLDDNEGLFINDLVDIGIGRFPVATLKEANVLVDKVERYYEKSSFGSWRNDVAFIADDGDANDGNTHMWQADSLANHLADNYDEINIKKIYLDNYYQESTPGGPRSLATQTAINNKVDRGALLINYTGHGGPLGWTQERILEVDQINKWSNIDNLPLFMTATCKFSYFDNPEEKSAGEYLLLNEGGGAIALLSTTRLVFVGPNYNLNTKFIQNVFKKQNGEFLCLGDLFKTTKILSGTSANNRNFTLLGDPALSLAFPKYGVRTTIISDTLKALSEVTIEGEIEEDGFVISDFNGTIYPTVYDKELIKTTLGQESCTPMPYRDQNNILYKGAATVTAGKFSFSFIVPKDIAYNFGAGKISYYAVSDDEKPVDASGSEKEFVIGGSANDIVYDYDEAELSLFINNRNFKDGGITDENPILIADVFDESGINTVGNGIGHDILAVLDGNTSNPYVLNDFYESAKDDYTTGTINFPFYNLEKGEHTLTLKVWDVFNNSSESTISFFVSDENEFTVADYITYPNPFSNSTDIYFQHNKPNQNLDVMLEIYSITGVLVKQFEETYNDDGYRIGPINWNGRNENGSNLSSGIYIAKLNIYAEDGAFTSNSIRIILLPQ